MEVLSLRGCVRAYVTGFGWSLSWQTHTAEILSFPAESVGA